MARNVLRSLHAHLERAGLPRQRFHDLRHAYATLLLEDGEELGVSAELWGIRRSRRRPMSTRT
jgi:site-specific recombinase XerD